MRDLPSGTVTFFFSDIEGSTRLLESLPHDYPELLERHRRVVRAAFGRHDGVEVSTEGDSFFAVFSRAADAVRAAIEIQRGMAAQEWAEGAEVKVRIGLHTGEGRLSEGDYVGLDVHRAARIGGSANGGQILLSASTRSLVGDGLDEGSVLRDLGEFRLRDLRGRERLFQVVARGAPDDLRPPRSPGGARSNVPAPSSPLVGREEELETLIHMLSTDDVRLITLTGPGGIGKTRLSLAAAPAVSGRFPDGVLFVDLSATRDRAAVLGAIVEALGLSIGADDDLRDALAERLRPLRLLLILDNFEQAMAAVNDLAELLRACPQLVFLVTSREALRIRGERLVPLGPLSLPDPATGSGAVGDLERYEAVRLFMYRAREARPGFSLSEANGPLVADICVRLDGLPLAIELAAARLSLFSLEELSDRLRSRLDALRSGQRDLPGRQRTLRSTIEWSYELLDDDEKQLFTVLSLFASARVDAVESVVERLEQLRNVDPVERLASLVDKSLLRSVEDPGGRRLVMLETIREYAADRLAQDPALGSVARRAHAEYFNEFAASRRGWLQGERREAGLDDLAAELGNLQLAWLYFVEAQELAALHSMLDVLWPLYEARGSYHAAIALTNDLLGVLSASAPGPERAHQQAVISLSLARGMLALRGYTEEVERLYLQALAASDRTASLPRQLPVLRSLASFYLYRGEVDKTAAIGRQLLELADDQGDAELLVEGHLLVGPPLALTGQPEEGLGHLERALELFDPDRHGKTPLRLGPRPGVAAAAVAALLYWLFGYPETSAARAATALELAARLRHPYSLAYATFHVAYLDVIAGRFESGDRHAQEVIRIAQENDYRIWEALGLVVEGVCHAAVDDAQVGLERMTRGIALYEGVQAPPVFWPAVLSLRAQACTMAGRHAEALDLLDRAISLDGGDAASIAVLLQKSELLGAMGERQQAEAGLWLTLDRSAQAGARWTELRAATRLAQLGATRDGVDAVTRLRDVYASLPEGHATPDVLAARSILDATGPARLD
ncbi:MAG TPA: adenylate/guanylate cyclase domain-containing protein [Candidatus Limnocylindrales bacterium]|nr:adenylate/guanylate cyclase domain-containing protein [Candidatus Limnocylindrales bacterium]